MTPDVAVVLLSTAVAAMGGALCLLLVSSDLQFLEPGEALEVAEDPDWEALDLEWRLRMATVSEAYWV